MTVNCMTDLPLLLLLDVLFKWHKHHALCNNYATTKLLVEIILPLLALKERHKNNNDDDNSKLSLLN